MAAKRHHHREGHYEGHEGRRHQEMRDAGMIHENHAAIANLPQEVMIKPWPDGGSYMPEKLDDSIRGVNEQISADDSKRMQHLKPHKY